MYPKERIVQAEESKKFTICGLDIDTFYYNIPKEQRNTTSQVTPNKSHVRPAKQFTGKYHPTCKIRMDNYNDYNVSETNIKHKTNTIYNPLDVKSISEINNIDPILAVSILVCQFHSLNKRLNADIIRIDKGIFIDYKHMKAAYTIIQNVNQSLDILYILHENNKFSADFNYTCITNSISTYFGDIHVIKRIYDMITDYNKMYNTLSYHEKRRIIDFIYNLYITEYKNKIEPTPPKIIKRSRFNVRNNIQNKRPQNNNPQDKQPQNINSNKKVKMNSPPPPNTTKKRLAFQQINKKK